MSMLMTCYLFGLVLVFFTHFHMMRKEFDFHSFGDFLMAVLVWVLYPLVAPIIFLTDTFDWIDDSLKEHYRQVLRR